MKHIISTLILTLNFCGSIISQHTFSIVAVDATTGEIGSAGATCIASEDGAITISDIILGSGAIHTQSYWSPVNQNNARLRMQNGDSPQDIIDWLVENDVGNNPTLRQYNIVDLNNGNPRSAGYTGANCFDEKIHITGPNYAIAGNILISESVIYDMEAAFLSAEGTLADRLMAAMQGAKRPGADVRCLSLGVSSSSAFIRVAQPTDTDPSLGNLSLDINVWISNTTFEPIDQLQALYNTAVSSDDLQSSLLKVYPNPTTKNLTVDSQDGNFDEYQIMDITGKTILTQSLPSPHNILSLDVSNFDNGKYFIRLLSKGNTFKTEQFQIVR